MPRITAPTSTSRRRNSLLRMIAVGPRETAVTGTGVVAAFIMLSPQSVLHPRIDDQVQEVDQEIDEHIEACDHEQRALNDRIVSAQDGGHDQVANARQSEDG